MSFFEQLTFFARRAPPVEWGPQRNGVITSQILGWALLLSQIIGLALAIVFVVALANDPDTPGFEVGGALFGTIFGSLIGFGFLVLWLWWLGWTMEQWAAGDVRAATHALVISIIQIVLTVYALLSPLFILLMMKLAEETGATTYTWMSWVNPMPLVVLGCAIALLVFTNQAKQQGQLA